MNEPLLELINVSYVYPGKIQALNRVNLKIYRNTITAIIGPNGSGKTTLLLICSGLLKPTEGKVLYKGQDLFEQIPLIRREIGIVFQDPDDQIFNLTVFDEIAFGLKQLRLPESEIRKKVEEVTKFLEISHLLQRSPFNLSYGEKKIIVLAAILVLSPNILILDEPTANVGGHFKRKIFDIIYSYKKQGKTVIFASHDILFTLRVADYIYFLNNGKIIAKGPKDEVKKKPDLFEKAGLESPNEILRMFHEIFK